MLNFGYFRWFLIKLHNDWGFLYIQIISILWELEYIFTICWKFVSCSISQRIRRMKYFLAIYVLNFQFTIFSNYIQQIVITYCILYGFNFLVKVLVDYLTIHIQIFNIVFCLNYKGFWITRTYDFFYGKIQFYFVNENVWTFYITLLNRKFWSDYFSKLLLWCLNCPIN